VGARPRRVVDRGCPCVGARHSDRPGRVLTLVKYVGPRGVRWGYRFWAGGQLVKQQVGSYELAKEAEKRARRERETAAFEVRWGPVTPALTDWATALEKYEHAKAKKDTLRDDLTRLRWWRAWAEAHGVSHLQGLTPDVVDAGLTALETETTDTGRTRHRPQTVRHYYNVLRHLGNLAVRRWRWLRENPVLVIASPAVPTSRRAIPTLAQARTLLAAAEVPLRRLIWAALYTGQRQTAVLRMTVELAAERPEWYPALDEKGDVEYWIPVASPLAALMRETGVVHGALWRDADGEAFRRFPRVAWERARAAAGLPRLRFHDLRHLVGITLAEAGVPDAVIQAFLGHASRQATLIYTRWVRDRALHAAAGTLSRAFAEPRPRRRRRARPHSTSD
jgi:integrase